MRAADLSRLTQASPSEKTNANIRIIKKTGNALILDFSHMRSDKVPSH